MRIREYAGEDPDFAVYATTNFSYDPADRLTGVIDPDGNTTELTYDWLGRKTSMDDPDMGEWSYIYDAQGNLTQQTDSRSQVLGFSYDDLNRLVEKKDITLNEVLAAYTYGTSAGSIGFRVGMSDETGSTSWSYGNYGRTVTETRNLDAASDDFTAITASDWLGRVQIITYRQNQTTDEVITYSYDAMGRNSSLSGSAAGDLVDISYNALGQISENILNNGIRVQNCYENNTHRLASRRAYPGSGVSCSTSEPDNDLMNFSYDYDDVGNIVAMEDYIEGETFDYTYDDLDRLVQVDAEDGSGYEYRYEYTYDRIGNLTEVLEWTGGGQAVLPDETIRVSLQEGYGPGLPRRSSGETDRYLDDNDLPYLRTLRDSTAADQLSPVDGADAMSRVDEEEPIAFNQDLEEPVQSSDIVLAADRQAGILLSGGTATATPSPTASATATPSPTASSTATSGSTATPTLTSAGPGTYEDDSSILRYIGEWASHSSGSYSDGTARIADGPGEYVEFATTGNRFVYYRTTGPDRGIACIQVDGGDCIDVDNYGNAFEYQQSETITMPLGSHTVRISYTSRKNTLAAGFLVTLDKITISQEATPTVTHTATRTPTVTNTPSTSGITVGDTTTASGYTNTLTFNHTVGSGETRALVLTYAWRRNNHQNSGTPTFNDVPLTFIAYEHDPAGDDAIIAMYYLLNPPVGTYEVEIPVSPAATILAGAYTLFGVDFNDPIADQNDVGGTGGPVSLTLDAISGDYAIDMAAIDGTSSLDQGSGQTELWDQEASGNGWDIRAASSLKIASSSQVTVSYSFPAWREFSYIGAVFRAYRQPTATPQYSSTPEAWPTPISQTPQPPGEYENTSGAFFYLGGWDLIEGTSDSGGSREQTTRSWSGAQLGFSGEEFVYSYQTGPSFGIADVYVDDVKLASVDLYSETAQAQQASTFTVLSGDHVLEIRRSGRRAPESSGYEINLDSVEVLQYSSATATPTPTLTPTPGGGTVDLPVLDAVSNYVSEPGSKAYSWSHTVGSDDNSILIVGLSINKYETDVNSVTYGTQALTELTHFRDLMTVSIWYLVNPDVGQHTITVNQEEGNRTTAGAVSFYHVDVEDPFGSPSTNSGTGASIAASAQAESGEITLDVWSKQGTSSTHTAGTEQTQIYQDATTGAEQDGNEVRGGMSYAEVVGQYTMTWTHYHADEWSHVVVPLKGDPGSSGPHGAGEGVLFDSAESGNNSNGDYSFSWSHTIGEGDNRLLLVGISCERHGTYVKSVSFGHLALTRLADHTNTVGAELWYLLDPPVGADTVKIILNQAEEAVAGSASFYQVDQDDPFNTLVENDGIDLISTTSSYNEGEMLVDLWSRQGTMFSQLAANGQISLWQEYTDSASNDLNDVRGGMSYKTSEGTSDEMIWGISGITKPWAHIVVPVRPYLGPDREKEVSSTPVFDSSTSYTPGSTVSCYSWDHTMSEESDGILVVGVALDKNGGEVSSISYGGESLQRLNRYVNSIGIELWYLLDPPTGENTVAVMLDSSRRSTAGAVSFTNVDQDTAFGSVITNGGESAYFDTAAAVQPGEILIDLWGKKKEGGNHSPTGVQVELWEGATDCAPKSTGDVRGGMSYAAPNVTPFDMLWYTWHSETWAHMVVPLRGTPIEEPGEEWVTYTYTYSSSQPHAVVAIEDSLENADTFVYDNAGNMTTRDEDATEWTQTFGPDNRLEQVTDGTDTWIFTYDGDGVRTIQENPDGSMTAFLFGGQYEVVLDAKGDTTEVKRYYTSSAGRVALRDGDGVHYLLSDHLGSVVAVLDDQGAVESKQRYLPYGGERYATGIDETDYGYTGQRDLGALGLMDYNARFYSPSIRRFISADSLIPDPASSQAFNRYSYVAGNPMVFVDPSGHYWVENEEQEGPTEDFISRFTNRNNKTSLGNAYISSPNRICYSVMDSGKNYEGSILYVIDDSIEPDVYGFYRPLYSGERILFEYPGESAAFAFLDAFNLVAGPLAQAKHLSRFEDNIYASLYYDVDYDTGNYGLDRIEVLNISSTAVWISTIDVTHIESASIGIPQIEYERIPGVSETVCK